MKRVAPHRSTSTALPRARTRKCSLLTTALGGGARSWDLVTGYRLGSTVLPRPRPGRTDGPACCGAILGIARRVARMRNGSHRLGKANRIEGAGERAYRKDASYSVSRPRRARPRGTGQGAAPHLRDE